MNEKNLDVLFQIVGTNHFKNRSTTTTFGFFSTIKTDCSESSKNIFYRLLNDLIVKYKILGHHIKNNKDIITSHTIVIFVKFQLKEDNFLQNSFLKYCKIVNMFLLGRKTKSRK